MFKIKNGKEVEQLQSESSLSVNKFKTYLIVSAKEMLI